MYKNINTLLVYFYRKYLKKLKLCKIYNFFFLYILHALIIFPLKSNVNVGHQFLIFTARHNQQKCIIIILANG